VCGVSVDSRFSHAAFAEQIGGVSFPLLSDFHPKGQVGRAYDVYVDQAGLDARATVIIDPDGKVVYSVLADGQRDMSALVAICEEMSAAWTGDVAGFDDPPGLPEGAELYVKDQCMFSRWARYARANLHVEDRVSVANVSRDEAAAARLLDRGGKGQAPALWTGSEMMYESDAIVGYLVDRAALRT